MAGLKIMKINKKALGSSFDIFLTQEEGYAKSQAVAVKRGEFKRDFPEIKLDETKLARVIGLTAVKSRKKRSRSPQAEMHREYLVLKQMHRGLRGFIRTLDEIRETVKWMSTTLREMNKDSAIFWIEFKRDFSEVKLDEDALMRLTHRS